MQGAGAGQCPARDFTAMAILRVIRRGGIYAARCNRTNIAIQRANRTGRIYAFPTDLPIVPPSSQKIPTAAKFLGGVGSPRPTAHFIKMCPQSGHTISPLLTLNSAHPLWFAANTPPCWHRGVRCIRRKGRRQARRRRGSMQGLGLRFQTPPRRTKSRWRRRGPRS